jgi:hypothetical protein
MRQLYLLILLFPIALVILSCDAPRENPLDPQNPDRPFVEISGKVLTESLPNSPIPDAEVYWENEGVVKHTGQKGEFQFSDLEKQNGWLTVEKQGYSKDSMFIDWNKDNTQNLQILLNSLPTADSINFYSIVQNKHAPGPQSEQLFHFVIEADVSDREGDVDSVFLRNNSLETSFNLTYNPASKFYEKTFTNYDISLDKDEVDEIVGKEFNLIVKTNAGGEIKIAEADITRLIKEEIEYISPANNELVEVPFEILWQRFKPGFSFEYLVQIYTNEISEEVIWEQRISSDSISVNMSENLASGDYYWVIWSIDEYLNRTRSKPATFTIE